MPFLDDLIADGMRREALQGITSDPNKRMLMQLLQMEQARRVDEQVPRGRPLFDWAPPARTMLPELSPNYRPPEYWRYGLPVRLA